MSIKATMTLEEARAQFHTDYSAAVERGDAANTEAAFAAYAESVSRILQAEYNSMAESSRTDDAALAARGVRVLTAAETKYYSALADALRQPTASAVKSALDKLEVVMPDETIDQVMTDVQTDFPLLDKINFVNASYLTKWLYNAKGVQTATWGAVGGEFLGELGGAFRQLSANLCKLTCIMLIPKDYLALGPRWLDRYVRAIMTESIGITLETAVVDGAGNANDAPCPIGMTRNLDSASTREETGLTTYSRKEAIKVTSFDPETYGSLLAKLSKTPTGRPRAIRQAMLVVNPTDYLSKVMPATTMLVPGGGYANNVLPFPTDIIQSVGCPSGYAVLGIPGKYLALLGVGSKKGAITYDDSARFIQDERVYAGKFVGNGRPEDNLCFVLLDISGLKPLAYKVEQVSAEAAAG